jgi:hypothetical protein
MTSRTPQCEVFWPFNSSSEFLGVPEDSKFPLLGVWASPSHLAQSGVATEMANETTIVTNITMGMEKKCKDLEKILKEIFSNSWITNGSKFI